MAADPEAVRSPSLYRKVAEDIKAAIAAGGYAAGTRLPSEHELAERYSVSRGTIRQAFAALRADGVIASRRGARRVVVGGPRVQSFGELLSFSRWVRAMGEVPGGQVVAMRRHPAKPAEAERLALPAGAQVYHLTRVRLLSGHPVMIERGTYPDRVGVLVAGMDLEKDSITERLEELGVVFADAEHVIDAVAASAEDARLLGVRPRVPMLRERRLTTDLAGRPVEWSEDRYLGSAAAFSVRNSVAVNALSRTPQARGSPQQAPLSRPLSSGSKCAKPGGVTAGSLARSSQRRTATASRANGSASNAAACSGVIRPPCSTRVRTDSCDSNPKYPGSVAHKNRFAATCSRTGSVTASPNHWLSHRAPASPWRLSLTSSRR
jgi:GntR family transcriptional regulator